MIHNILLSEASIYGIGNRLLELSTEDLPLDEPIRAARRYKKITAKEIKAAFAKWIRPEDLAQVTRGPEPH
jgi:zinc protease